MKQNKIWRVKKTTAIVPWLGTRWEEHESSAEEGREVLIMKLVEECLRENGVVIFGSHEVTIVTREILVSWLHVVDSTSRLRALGEDENCICTWK